MILKTYTHSLKTTKREAFIQITKEIEGLVNKSEVARGWVKIFCPHSTAAVTINQNANPDVMRDVSTILHTHIPQQQLLNVEGNSDAHFKSSMMGANLEIPIENGKMVLGGWQGIFFCEFDGPRSRSLIVQVFSP